MAIVIGAGISIGGGIGLGADAPAGGGGGGPTPDTFTVANLVDGSTNYYGAYNYTSGANSLGISDFGTITSDYFYGIYYRDDGASTYSSILLNNGTYSGFTVFNGIIDSDPSGYPRVFTIGGVDYIFYHNGSGIYTRPGSDALGLAASVGSTVSAVYNPAAQLTIPTGSILVGTYTSGFYTQYGANRSTPGYGYVNTDYIQSIDYDSSNPSTTIQLVPGTYTGFTVAANGAVDSDGTGSKVFTVSGTNSTFNVVGPSNNLIYLNMSSDTFGLVANLGQVVTAVYEPAQNTGGGGGGGGGGGAFATGTMTVGTNDLGAYGWADMQYGSSSFSGGGSGVMLIRYESSNTTIYLMSGTYNGVVIDTSAGTVGGETSITVTIDGITATLAVTGNHADTSGDAFSLQSKNGQTLNVSMTAGAGGGGGGGGGATTYSVNTDYSSSPSGISFQDNYDSTYQVTITQPFWTNAAGFTALSALTMGSTFTVTMPLGGSSPRTITLSSSWSGSSIKTTTVTSSSPLTLPGGSNNVPLTVTV